MRTDRSFTRSLGTSAVRKPKTISLVIIALLALQLISPAAVNAAPVLSVSTSVSKPLLGGTATVSVTVTNTGDEKGYNLSVTDVLASDLANPNGRVTITGSSVPPTTVSLDSGTGDTTVEFYDVVDLAPTESFTITYQVSIAGDPSWEVGRLLTAASSARVNTVPDNSGSWITGTGTAQAEVIPIDLVYKNANQSTSVQQDSGTTTRAYSYSLRVQNNHVNPSASVVVTDTVPDGVEFLGVLAGPALDSGYPQRDPVTGETHLRWTLGTLAPGAAVDITYGAGVRYDYYGTTNGGTNRTHDDFTSEPATGAIIPHKTGFTNTAMLRSEYRGSLPATITPTDSDSAGVEATYITINKSGTPSTGGHGTIVEYTLTYATSEYYTADTIAITDTLPDGMTYVASSASPAPSSVTANPDGTTVIVWDALPALGTTDGDSVTFRASVDTTWEQTAYAGEPIRAGDTMTNTAELAANWYDQVKPWRSGSDVLVAQVSAGLSTGLPAISKDVWDPDLGTWTDAIDAQVGDTLLYRARFNTADGLTPLRDDIALGYITLTDWLPPGTVYNGDATPSHDATFTLPPGVPPSVTLNPDVPRAVTIASLNGLEWFLGDVSADGWWETTFTVTVQNLPVVQEGLKTGNHWKLTGVNTFGQEYSDRDIATLDYHQPRLTLDKVASSVPNPLVAGSVVGYTITIDNIGGGHAEDMVVTDYVPVGARATTPTVNSIAIDGAPLAPAAWQTSYSAATGRFDIDLTPSLPGTGLPAGSRMVIVLGSTVDQTTGAGTTLTDIATVAYNTQPDGSGRQVAGTTNVADENTDDAAVTLTRATIAKSGPAGPIRVGDTLTYNVDVTVPAGAILYWPRIIDRSDSDAVWYVPGTATISTIAGTPPVAAAFDTTSTPVRTQTATNNRTDFTWNLANPIDNRGPAEAYQFRLQFTVQYTGVRDAGTQELYPPGASDIVRNRSGRIEWHTTDPATRPGTPNSNAQSGSVTTQVDQPVVALDKTEFSTGPYAGDSGVTYQVVLTNPTFGATAYDLYWQDVLPTYLGSPALVSATHSSLGDITGSITPDFSATPTVTIDFGGVSLAQGQSITIRYSAVVDPDVPAGTSLTNTADVDWSSLPGTPAGSRRYDDAAWESYTGDTDSVTIPIAQPQIAKSVVGPSPARIGDTVAYRMRVTVPAETVLPSAYLLDTITADGFTYVPGSVALSQVSGSPESAAAVASATFDDTPSPGATLRVDFTGDIDNSSALPAVGDTPYVFDVEFDLVYDGLTDGGGWTFFPPSASDTVADTGSLHWTVGGSPRSVSAAASTTIAQPILELTKTESPLAGPYAGGETVGYRAVIENTGWATAYSISWMDVLAPETSDPAVVAVEHSSSGDILAAVTVDASSDDTVTIGFGGIELAPGESITVDWTAVVDPGTGAGRALTNTADVDWESHPTSPTRRVYDDSPSEAAYTADTDQATVQVDFAVIDKAVQSGITTRTIGETYSYLVSFSIPSSTTAYNVVIVDVVPDGLTVLSATPSAPLGTVSVLPEVAGQTTVLWNVGDVSNPPVDALELDIVVRVDDAYFGGTPLDGLPASVDGDPGDSLLNTASISWDDAAIGGTTRNSSDSVTVTITEPHVTIDKTADKVDLAAGETVRYTVRVANTGIAAAHDLRWSDVVPATLFGPAASPSLVRVDLDGSALSEGTDYTASFGVSTTSTVDLVGPLPAGSELEIVYDATLVGGVPRGVSLSNTARVERYSTLPGPVVGERSYGPVSDGWTVLTRAPVLSLDKRTLGDLEIQRGQAATFELSLTNSGDATAHSVVMTDTLPVGLTYVPGSVVGLLPGIGAFNGEPAIAGQVLTWSFGGALDLAPSDTATLTFEAVADSDAPLGTLTNAAVGGGNDGAGVSAPPAGDSDTVLVTDPRVAVLKRPADGQDPFVQVGEQVTFVVAVTNTGSTRLDSIRLEDAYDDSYLVYRPASTSPPADSSVPGTLVWTDVTGAGSLAVGATTTITVGFEVTAKPPTNFTTDVATVTSAIDEYGDSAPPVSSSAQAGITSPDTLVTKRRAATQPATVSVGAPVAFEIDVTNSGDTTISALALSDVYDPAIFNFESAVPSADVTATGSVSWTDVTTSLGDIPPGDTVTVALLLRSIAPGLDSLDVASVTSALDVNGDTPGLSSDSATATVVAPTLVVSKSANATSAGPGDTIAYTVVIENVGDGPAHGIVLTDEIPAQLWPPVITSILLDGVTALVHGADFTVDLSVLHDAELSFLAPLAAGSRIEVTYDVELAAGTPAGLSLVNTASAVYSSLPGLDPHEIVYGSNAATATLATRAPSLGITKELVGDTELQAGQEFAYRVTVTNTGDAPARSVSVTDTLPPGIAYVPGSTEATWSAGGVSTADPTAGPMPVWDFGGGAFIDPGDSLTLEFRAEVLSSSATGLKTNSVVADARDGGGWPLAPVSASADVLVTRPEAAIEKRLATGQDPYVQMGETVAFEIVVTNTGTTAIETLELADAFDATYLAYRPTGTTPPADSETPGLLGWADLTGPGSLAPGATTTVTVSFDVVGHPSASMTSNVATARGMTDEYGDPVPEISDAEPIGITAPSVSITKRLADGQPDVVALGQEVRYEIAVENSGDTTLAVLPLTDTYVDGLEFVSADPAPSSTDTGTLEWNDLTENFGDLAPGRRVTLEVRFIARGAGPALLNTATVADGTVFDINGDGAPGASDGASVDVYNPADVVFTKTADPPEGTIVLPGQPITYAITLYNSTEVTLTSVAFRDELPGSISYDPGTLVFESVGTTMTLTDILDGDAGQFAADDGVSGTVVANLGDIAPGETVVLTFGVIVGPEEVSRQGVANSAIATLGGRPLAEAGPIHHPVDPFVIVKTGRDVNGGRLAPGDDIEWTIVVTNTGLTQTTNVVVTDSVPPETTYVPGSMTGRGADESAAPNLVWNVGVLEVDESVTLTFRSRVRSGIPAGTEIRNQAVVSADQSAPKLSDFPETTELGDPTLLRTGGNDWVWLVGALLALLTGAALLRRRPVTVQQGVSPHPRYRPRRR